MNHKIKVLIVEDEPMLAELNAEFIQRNPDIKAIGIASNLMDARNMVDKLKPQLILLDNYLPDGQGIELFEYMINNDYPCYVIFITAASDMETCSKALRYGAFDYLIKPVSYERLKHSLERFQLFINKQSNNTRQLNQRKIDELFNLQTKDFTELVRHTKGIEEITLEKIRTIFTHESKPQTVEDIVKKVNISKTTTRRYLEYCVQTKFLMVEVNYGKVGRPERLYIKIK